MKEHDIITTSVDIDREYEQIPKGSKGTIIHVWNDGTGYIVEFPDNKTVTVYKEEIE